MRDLFAALFLSFMGVSTDPSVLGGAFALGFAIWGDVPRREVFFGAALIIAAGLLIVGTEHFRKRL